MVKRFFLQHSRSLAGFEHRLTTASLHLILLVSIITASLSINIFHYPILHFEPIYIYIYKYIYSGNWQNQSLIIPDSCPHRPYFLVSNLHVYSLCFKMSYRPQAKRRRFELLLKTKIDLIQAAESVPKLNQKQLAEKFGIDTSTIF